MSPGWCGIHPAARTQVIPTSTPNSKPTSCRIEVRYRVKRFVGICLLLVALVAVGASARTVQDASIRDGEFAGFTFGGGPMLEVGCMGGIYAEHHCVSLIRFRVAPSSCSQATWAKLRLYKPRDFVQTAPVRVRIFEVAPANAGWVEGGSICSTDSRACSWRSPAPGKSWAGGEGCGREGVDYLTPELDAGVAPDDRSLWMEFSIPIALVRKWAASPETNAGLLITSGDDHGKWGDHAFFYSSEHYDREKRPRLVIGPTAVGAASAGDVRADDASVVGAVSAGDARADDASVVGAVSAGDARSDDASVVGAASSVDVRADDGSGPRLPSDAYLDGWLKAGKRLAGFTTQAKMTREQARVFCYMDTTVRRDQIIGLYQAPLAGQFDEIERLIAANDTDGVKRTLGGVWNSLLCWEYIRETSWYTAGPLAEVLTPKQLAILFGSSIFGRMEEGAKEKGDVIWQARSGDKLGEQVKGTIDSTARKLGLSPEQMKPLEPKLSEYERLEHEFLALFNADLVRVKSDGGSEDEILRNVKSLHQDHERFLYYQSVYSAPRWNLFMRGAPTIPFAKWIVEGRRRMYNKESVKRQLKAVEDYAPAGPAGN